MPIKQFIKQHIFSKEALFLLVMAFLLVFLSLNFSNTVELANVKSQKSQINSQNAVFLSYNMIRNKKVSEAFGGVDISFSDGVLKLKNSTSLQNPVLDELVEKGLHKQDNHYFVQKGDTVGRIAYEFGVSPSTIVWANNLKRNIIKPGQELIIPAESGLYHLVKKGDTLTSLAKLYKADEKVIFDFNEFRDNETLEVGKKIFIPGGKKKVKKPHLTPGLTTFLRRSSKKR